MRLRIELELGLRVTGPKVRRSFIVESCGRTLFGRRYKVRREEVNHWQDSFFIVGLYAPRTERVASIALRIAPRLLKGDAS